MNWNQWIRLRQFRLNYSIIIISYFVLNLCLRSETSLQRWQSCLAQHAGTKRGCQNPMVSIHRESLDGSVTCVTGLEFGQFLTTVAHDPKKRKKQGRIRDCPGIVWLELCSWHPKSPLGDTGSWWQPDTAMAQREVWGLEMIQNTNELIVGGKAAIPSIVVSLKHLKKKSLMIF